MRGLFKFKHVQLGLITQKPVSATSCLQTECQSWVLCVSLLLPSVFKPPPPFILSITTSILCRSLQVSACVTYFHSVCFIAIFVSSSRLSVNFILVLIIPPSLSPLFFLLRISSLMFLTLLLTTSADCYHLLCFSLVSFLMQHTTKATYLSLFPSHYLYSQLSCL